MIENPDITFRMCSLYLSEICVGRGQKGIVLEQVEVGIANAHSGGHSASGPPIVLKKWCSVLHMYSQIATGTQGPPLY